MTRFGIWFAVWNADAMAAPSVEEMSTVRRKPVMREMSVAMAMEPPARTTSASEVPSEFSADAPADAGT